MSNIDLCKLLQIKVSLFEELSGLLQYIEFLSRYTIWITSRSPNRLLRCTKSQAAAGLACLGSLSTNAAGKLDVLGHDSDTLGVNGAQVGVLKQANKVGLSGFLQSQDSGGLESEIRLEVLGNLTDKALEGSLADEEIRRLLVLADLAESDGSRSVAVGLLDTSSSGGGLAGGLHCQRR